MRPTGGVEEVPPGEAGASRIDVLLDAMFTRAEASGLAANVALAGTTVRLHLEGADTLTLLLDREPLELVRGDAGEAEVDIDLTGAQLHGFLTGEDHLQTAILRGEVDWTGPVWKFLRVMPILRRLARETRVDGVDAGAEAAE